MLETSATSISGSSMDGLYSTADDEETRLIAAAVLARLAGDTVAESSLTIGRYLQAEVRARGGMGRVFVAYDPKLDRKVALKALPVGIHPHEPAAAVSRREGQALAGIDHPNVVHVYEVIEHQGLDCLVLEHVDGLHLGEWLVAAPRAASEVLHKFVLAGEGLAAVHRARLVHRDFKPANVVVGADAVKLIDFGLAAPATPRGLPEPDELACIGTPRYMAPEQIRGLDVDARSDQFSFCVALYEALLGVHPFVEPAAASSLEDGSGTIVSEAAVATRRAVFADMTEGTLRRPAIVPPGVARHVVAALERGLQRDPARRFASMDDLLAELRRDPRRGRRRTVTAALLALAGLAIAVTVWIASQPAVCPATDETAARLWHGQRAAVAERLAAFGERPMTVLDARAEALADAQANRCAARARGDRHDLDHARDACLQAREAEFAAVVDLLVRGDREAVESLTAQLGDMPDVRGCEDVALQRDACPSETSLELTRGTAALLARDFKAAEAAAEGVRGSSAVQASDGLAIQADILLGRVWYEQGDWARAGEALGRAVKRAEEKKCFGAAIDAYLWRTKLGAFDPAVPLARVEDWLELYDWRVPDNDKARSAEVLNNRGLVAWRRGDGEKGSLLRAEAALQDAIALRMPTFDLTSAQADSYLNLASVLSLLGRDADATAALDKAQRRREEALGPQHPLLWKELFNRGNREFEAGRPRAAGPLYERALALAQSGLGPDAPAVGQIHMARMRMFERDHDAAAALAAGQAAERVYAKLPADDLRRGDAQSAIAQALIVGGQYTEAKPWLAKVEAQLAAHPDENAARRGVLAFRWADVHNNLEELPAAEDRARSALEWFDRAGFGPQRIERAHASLYLGESLLAQRRPAEAAPAFERAVEIWASSGDNAEMLAWARWGLAKSLCPVAERRADMIRHAKDASAWFAKGAPEMLEEVRSWLGKQAAGGGAAKCRSAS